MSEYDNDLLAEGILRFKAKEFAAARDYLERALQTADDGHTRARANFYLSQLAEDPREKRRYLEETLAVEMTHAEARRALAILDGRLQADEIIDPNAIPPTQEGTVAVPSERFTCPKCGGRMVYSPDGQSLLCESCRGRERLGADLPAQEQDFFAAMADGKGFRTSRATRTFQCQGCGAGFILPTGELSAPCAYCGSMHVVALEQLKDLVPPDAVIPMAFNQEQAASYLVHWIEGQKIQPQEKVSPPHGFYLPVWDFDLAGNIPWSGRVIRNRQSVPVSGEEAVQLDHLCVPGSERLTNLLPSLLSGYDLRSVSSYDPRFLAGWPLEVYTISMSNASLKARQMAVEKVRRLIHARLGQVEALRYSPSSIAVSSYRLVLIPLWAATYTLKAKSYRVVINGQTGAMLGEAPARGLRESLKDWIGRERK